MKKDYDSVRVREVCYTVWISIFARQFLSYIELLDKIKTYHEVKVTLLQLVYSSTFL